MLKHKRKAAAFCVPDINSILPLCELVARCIVTGGPTMQSSFAAVSVWKQSIVVAFGHSLRCKPNTSTPLRLTGSALGLAVVLFGASYARADTITYTATGFIPNAGVCCTPVLQAQFPVGTRFTYSFTLDTAAAGTTDGSPLNMHYDNGLVSSSGSLGSYVFSTGSGPLQVGKQPNYDKFEVLSSNVTGAPVGGSRPYSVAFVLRDDTRTALSGGAVPTSLNLSAFSRLGDIASENQGLGLQKLNLIFGDLGEIITLVTGLVLTERVPTPVDAGTENFLSTSVNGSVPSDDVAAPVSDVPVPAALPMFATGLGGMGLLGWRRRRKIIAQSQPRRGPT